jgi:endo-1,4-beta-D-glucanase Y
LDEEILAETNKVRLDPTYLIPFLQAKLDRFTGNDYKELGKLVETTSEGATAVNNAITYL